MAVVLALESLYTSVVARMDADTIAADPEATPVPQPFGWRRPAQQPRAPRIVWVPGDDESGDIGELGPARNPGRNPRPLWTLGELFTVYVEGVDASALENELAQYHAARVLLDAWLRAIYRAAYGTIAVQSIAWVNERKERRYGAAIRVLATIEAMVPDAPYATAPVDVVAQNTTHPSATDEDEGETDTVSAS